MKSLVTAAVVIALEAGFLLGVAQLPGRSEPAPAGAAVAARQAPAPAAPAARPPSRS
jgi:hypothetical protein